MNPVIVNFDGAGASKSAGRFGTVTARNRIVKVIVARHVSTTPITINGIRQTTSQAAGKY